MTRFANRDDIKAIKDIYRDAFPKEESNTVADLAERLIEETSCPTTYSLVSESKGSIVAHVAFSPVHCTATHALIGYILAPLAVLSEFQGNRFGSGLIEKGINLLKEQNTSMLFVYGDPQYYARFGFADDIAANFKPPFKLKYEIGWQAMQLSEATLPQMPINISCVSPLMDPVLW